MRGLLQALPVRETLLTRQHQKYITEYTTCVYLEADLLTAC